MFPQSNLVGSARIIGSDSNSTRNSDSYNQEDSSHLNEKTITSINQHTTESAVVDESLRVIGVKGLYIAG